MSNTSEFQLASIASPLLGQDQHASFLRNANQLLSEVYQKHHSIKIGKSALVGSVDIQVLEITTHKAGKVSVNRFLDDHDGVCKTFKKRQKSRDVFTRIHLQYVGVASRVLKSVPSCCARKAFEACPFDAVQTRRRSRGGEYVSTHRVITSSGEMIAPTASKSIV